MSQRSCAAALVPAGFALEHFDTTETGTEKVIRGLGRFGWLRPLVWLIRRLVCRTGLGRVAATTMAPTQELVRKCSS